MGEIVKFPDRKGIGEEELQNLYRQYPELERLLGDKYKIRKHKTGGYYVRDNKGEVQLGLKLFMTISRAYNL